MLVKKCHFSKICKLINPSHSYAASKKSAELLAYSYHKLYNIDVSVLRYFTVLVQPMGGFDMSIFRFIKWIDEGLSIELFGDGTQSRDFTYVDDIANGTIAATREVGYEIINLGGGQNHFFEHNYRKVRILIGKKLSLNTSLFILPI